MGQSWKPECSFDWGNSPLQGTKGRPFYLRNGIFSIFRGPGCQGANGIRALQHDSDGFVCGKKNPGMHKGKPGNPAEPERIVKVLVEACLCSPPRLFVSYFNYLRLYRNVED